MTNPDQSNAKTDNKNGTEPVAIKDNRSRIVLPWRWKQPIRVRVTDGEDKQEYQVVTPFRAGYSNRCEIPLGKGDGPDTLIEFAPPSHPLQLSTPHGTHINADSLIVSVDGQPLSGNNQALQSGSVVDVHDRKGNRHITLSVDIPGPSSRKHVFAVLFVLAAIAALTVYAWYAWQSLQEAESRIATSERRIEYTETGLEKFQSQISAIVARTDANELSHSMALKEIDSVQQISQQHLQDEFADGIRTIRTEMQRSLQTYALNDNAAREQLAAATEESIARLQTDISEKMFMSQEALFAAQEELMLQNQQRLEDLEIKSAVFKKILAASKNAIVFVRTSYRAELISSGIENEFSSTGTGFISSNDGVVITPQHVMKPWLYDDSMLMMLSIGSVRIIPESIVHTVWTTGQLVVDPSGNEPVYQTQYGFSETSEDLPLRVLYIADSPGTLRKLQSPFGMVEVKGPRPGPSDIAVLQLLDFTRQFPALTIEQSSSTVESLDEVLLLGYPMSRLSDGLAVPEAVKGLVRRPVTDILELHSAVHPGASGAPVINASGNVVGMAVANIGSDSYGAAIPHAVLLDAIKHTRSGINWLKEQVSERGCDAGALNGVFDQKLWSALQTGECNPVDQNQVLSDPLIQ